MRHMTSEIPENLLLFFQITLSRDLDSNITPQTWPQYMYVDVAISMMAIMPAVNANVCKGIGKY